MSHLLPGLDVSLGDDDDLLCDAVDVDDPGDGVGLRMPRKDRRRTMNETVRSRTAVEKRRGKSKSSKR